MSLTSHIRQQTEVYQYIKSQLNLSNCIELINHQNHNLSQIKHEPIKDTNFSLTGASVIYGLRNKLFAGYGNWFNRTVASQANRPNRTRYPNHIPLPYRYIYMAMLDGLARGRNIKVYDSLPVDLQPTLEDVTQILEGLSTMLFPQANLINYYHPNPSFALSADVGGADANMIIDGTLVDIRTTAKRTPLDLDNIIQQVGYYLLDAEDEYSIDSITWIYTRQEIMFDHPISYLLSDEKQARLGFLRLVDFEFAEATY